MMNNILVAAQVVVLLAIGTFLLQIWRKFQSIPDDDVIGEERAKYMQHRLIWVAICIGLETVLQVASRVLRVLEII